MQSPARGILLLGAAIVSFSRFGVAASTPNVVASQNSSLILSASNTVCSVGLNDNGQLGDGTSVPRSVLVQASYLNGSSSISLSPQHGLAVKADNTVWSWGNNANGQLGDGTRTSHPTPYQVPDLAGYVSVAAGGVHSIALKNDRTVWAWGNNDQGQLGDGSTVTRPSPVQVVNLDNVTAIAASTRSSYALKADGTVWAWGQNNVGQLGDNTTTNRVNAIQVSSNVLRLATTASHVLVIKTDNSVWGWGFNDQGQLGDGSTIRRPREVRAGSLSGIVAIAAGSFHSMAVDSGGNVWSWGDNGNGQLGDGSTADHVVPTRVPSFSGAALASANVGSSYILKTDGSTWAWGDNTNGQLGIGTAVRSPIPVAAKACIGYPVAPGPVQSSNVVRLSASATSSLALAKDNTALSWGQNDSGQLGDGTTISRNAAGAVSGVGNGTGVSLGATHGLIVKSDGTVFSWGTNRNGELGDGTLTARPTPVTIPNFSNAVSIAAGQVHSLALKADGTVWAWGNNDQGQLGDGTNISRPAPTRVVNLSGVVAIASSSRTSYALKTDGTVWAWGQNNVGQVGDNTTTNRVNAVQVPNLANVVAIAASDFAHVLVLKNDGTVWGWGFNDSGELGDGSTQRRFNIVRVSDLTNVVALAAGSNHSLAVRSDGTVWSWGFNGAGQLGNGTSTSSNVPVQVTGLTSALAVAGGTGHSLALFRDGSVWAWGSNTNGQFGAAAPTQSTVPVRTQINIGPFWTLTYNQAAANGSTSRLSPPHSDNVYVDGSRVCFMPAPVVGFAFAGYTGAALDSSNCITVGANATVTGSFILTPPLRFVPVTPCRIADTRNPAGPFGAPIMAADSTRDFVIPQSACNIPATAKAYSLNFTVVPPAPLSFLTVWPTGLARPNASTLNSFDGRVKANGAIIPAGANEAISVYSSDATHAIIDIDGYFTDDTANASALAFYPITPCRLTDTRNAAGAFGAPALTPNQTRTFPLLSGACNLPPTAKAYSLNMTVVPKEPLTFLTVWPAGQAQPLVSTLNAFKGEVAANAAVVPAGANGDVNVFVTNNTELIIDVNGYFAAPGTGGLSLYNVTPCRVIDTRSTPGSAAFKGSISVNAATSGCFVPAGAQSLVYNATVVPPGPLTFLSLWPSQQTQPVVSTLNSFDGVVASNLAIVPDANGSIDAFTSDLSHLILDVSGYFAAPQ